MGRAQGLLVVGVAALALVGCSSGSDFTAQMNGAKERPNPVTTNAGGEASVKLDEGDQNVVTVNGSFQGLTGAAIAAHIHGPANEDQAADILCGLTASPSVSGTVTGTCNFTDEQVDQLRDGLMYINVHTPQYPAGEIRGQIE
jgi:hypothetical protein